MIYIALLCNLCARGKVGELFIGEPKLSHKWYSTWKDAVDAMSGPSLTEIRQALDEHDVDIMTGPHSDHGPTP